MRGRRLSRMAPQIRYRMNMQSDSRSFMVNITAENISKRSLEEKKLGRRPGYTQELKTERNGSSHTTQA